MDISPTASLFSLESESASCLQHRESNKRRFNKSGLPSQGEETTAIHVIECWIYGGCQPPMTGCEEIGESSIERWLRQPGPIEYKPAPTAGLRLLCRQQETSGTLPFKTDTLDTINEILGLTEAHSYLNTRGAGVCGHYLENSNQPGLLKSTPSSASETSKINKSLVFVYHRSNNDGAISAVIRYDSERNITIGYILLGPRISANEVHEAIISHFRSFPQPLVIPTTIAELTATDLLSEMTLVHLGLAKIEQDTGFGDWKNATVGITRMKPQEWARQLGALTCRFVFLEAAVQCTSMAADFTMRELASMSKYISTSRASSLDTVGSNLRGRVEFLSSNLAHLQIFASISKRLQAQQNFVCRVFIWPYAYTNCPYDSCSISCLNKTII